MYGIKPQLLLTGFKDGGKEESNGPAQSGMSSQKQKRKGVAKIAKSSPTVKGQGILLA